MVNISNNELIGYYRQYCDTITKNNNLNKHLSDPLHIVAIPFIDWALGFMKRYEFVKEPEHIRFCVSNGNCGAQDRIISELVLCANHQGNNNCSCLREV